MSKYKVGDSFILETAPKGLIGVITNITDEYADIHWSDDLKSTNSTKWLETHTIRNSKLHKYLKGNEDESR